MADKWKHTLKTAAIAGAIALMLNTGPVAAADQATTVEDLWIEGALSTTYMLNTQLNPFDIDAEVDNGVVTLRGQVESPVEKDLAGELALGIDGVTKVNNELTVGKMQPDTERGKGGFAGLVQDANITAKVKSQLLWNQNTHGLQIDVDTQDRNVLLQGTVDSEAEAQLAEQIARNTQGVRSVESRLRIADASSGTVSRLQRSAEDAADEVSDAWITTKVESALMFNRDIDMAAFEIETDDGVVHLTGVVRTPSERDEAIAIARGIRGVKDVDSDIEVVDSP